MCVCCSVGAQCWYAAALHSSTCFSLLAGGWVCLRKVEEGWEGTGRKGGREGGGQREVDRATYPQAEELVKGGGGGGSPRAREAERKNRGGGWRLDVDTKCGVISHVVCVTGFMK